MKLYGYDFKKLNPIELELLSEENKTFLKKITKKKLAKEVKIIKRTRGIKKAKYKNKLIIFQGYIFVELKYKEKGKKVSFYFLVRKSD